MYFVSILLILHLYSCSTWNMATKYFWEIFFDYIYICYITYGLVFFIFKLIMLMIITLLFILKIFYDIHIFKIYDILLCLLFYVPRGTWLLNISGKYFFDYILCIFWNNAFLLILKSYLYINLFKIIMKYIFINCILFIVLYFFAYVPRGT